MESVKKIINRVISCAESKARAGKVPSLKYHVAVLVHRQLCCLPQLSVITSESVLRMRGNKSLYSGVKTSPNKCLLLRFPDAGLLLGRDRTRFTALRPKKGQSLEKKKKRAPTAVRETMASDGE